MRKLREACAEMGICEGDVVKKMQSKKTKGKLSQTTRGHTHSNKKLGLFHSKATRKRQQYQEYASNS